MSAPERGLLYRLVERARRRSAWLFHFNAGACNGCDIELVACLTPRFDVEQLGARLQGSPRHADVLCVTGPGTRATLEALKTIHAQLPEPKVVLAIGSCAATGNVFAGSPVIAGPIDRIVPVSLYVPGCPPSPGAIMEGVVQALDLLGQGRGGTR